jgi:hypothetical protein
MKLTNVKSSAYDATKLAMQTDMSRLVHQGGKQVRSRIAALVMQDLRLVKAMYEDDDSRSVAKNRNYDILESHSKHSIHSTSEPIQNRASSRVFLRGASHETQKTHR